jgi:cytochrome c peroxidase
MNKKSLRILVVAGLSAAALAACATSSMLGPRDARLSLLPPVSNPDTNPGGAAAVALGKQLFVDARLSGNGKMSCQGCHYRHLGWTDGLKLSAKADGSMNTRHTPSLYNVGYQSAWYWDGRATTLEAQVLAAWRNQLVADPAKIVETLNSVPGYASAFRSVYGGPATADNVAKALSAYLRTKNSDDSPWDRYERGERGKVSSAAVAGYQVFIGKGKCVTCHTPPYYGNSTFYNVGLEAGKATPDVGRNTVTKADADRGSFKTPSLRSVGLSKPYFHDGSAATLEDAVRYMARGGNADPNKTPLLTDTKLTDTEIRNVVAFLESLTSEEEWEAPALP